MSSYFFQKIYFYVYQCVTPSTYVCHVCAWCCKGHKRSLEPLELELQTVVNFHGAWNQTQVSYKSSKCS